jgi:molybdopterin-binding protein
MGLLASTNTVTPYYSDYEVDPDRLVDRFLLLKDTAPGYCLLEVRRPDVTSLSRKLAMLSARNQLAATVKSVKLGNVMAEVVMNVGNFEIVSAITRGSAEQLDLKTGDKVKAVIKATEVLIDKS